MAALPINVDTSAVEKQHAPAIGGFRERMGKIQDRKPSLTVATVAADLALDAKHFIDGLEEQRKQLKAPILEAGKNLDAFFAKMSEPAIEARKVANGAIAAWDAEQRRIAAEEAEREAAEARRQAEERRKAEADAIAAQAAEIAESNPQQAEALLEAAAEVEQAPVVPVAIVAAAPKKIEGTSTRWKLKGAVKDGYALMRWMIDHKGVIGVKFSDGDIDRALARGLELPGVEVTKTPIVSNRG